MLDKIHLKNFKKFQDVEVQLSPPFTVLMGENSSGKTTILQAIHFALRGLRDLLHRPGGPIESTLLSNNVILYNAQNAAINISGGSDLFCNGVLSSERDPTIELTYSPPDTTYHISIKFPSLGGSLALEWTSRSENLTEIYKMGLGTDFKQSLLISGFAGPQTREQRKSPQAIQESVRAARTNEIIGNLLLNMKEQAESPYFQRAGKSPHEKLMRILDRYFNLHIKDVLLDSHTHIITPSCSEGLSDVTFFLSLSSLGSGLQQVLQILVPIYCFASKDTIILLDEPDAHLHTNLQYTLAQALREVQKELEIQIIISTHSIPIIEAADPSEVVPVYPQAQHIRPLTEIVEVREAISNYIDNYHLARAKISGKLLFIEDEDTSILKKFDEILQTRCFLGVDTIPYVPDRGRNDKVPFSLRDIFKAYLGQKNIEIHFLIDGDALPDKWKAYFTKYAESKEVILHQLNLHEIENYLLNPDLLCRALKAKFPQKEQDIPAVDEMRDLLTDIMKEVILYEKVPGEKKLQTDIDSRITQQVAMDRTLIETIFAKPKSTKLSVIAEELEKEANDIMKEYLRYTSFDELVRVASGKETFTELNKWLQQKKMYLSTKDILGVLTAEDIPGEIIQLLMLWQLNTPTP